MSKERSELHLWHDYDALLGDKTIYIGSGKVSADGESGVDELLSERVIKNLHILDKRTHDQGIFIKLNCVGGDVHHGLAIHDAIKECKNHVTITTYGTASSMGSIILQAGDTRIMTKHASLMLHPISACLSGSIYEIEKQLEAIKQDYKDMLNIYIKKIKQAKSRFSMNQLEDKMRFHWEMRGKEAIEFGLCDKVLE